MIGARLSHFEITGKLGEGGMGAVYRATDSKLGREVAIKVLPEAFTEDPERLARFEREARVLAALEHPNIAGIYEVGSGLVVDDGAATGGETVHYLAMQLAPGEDLASRLERGPMPLEEALATARQIAEALEAAHERGIVHRDLKPANVVLGPDGTVKVLDFGLAKAWEQEPGASPDLIQSPTLTARMTQAGIILGTAGYMSPEQARGQEAGPRSDVWSFGVVLWEMLTGAQLFAADTVSDTIARVLMAEPDWDAVDAELPAPIAHLLRRCLERDPKIRLQAIGEARIRIDDYLADPQANAATVPVASVDSSRGTSSAARTALWLALGTALGAVLALAALWPRDRDPSAEVLRYAVQSPAGSPMPTQDVHGIDISPDGRKMALVAKAAGTSDSMIYLKTYDSADLRPIPGTEGARIPFFSPDGEWIGYFTERELRKISLDGGGPQTLAQTVDRRGAVWHPDGTIYFVPHSAGPVMRIASNGGPSTQVTRLDKARRERTHRWPALLPDGTGLVYTSDTYATTEFYDDARIELLDLATGERKVLLEGSSRALFSPTGHLLFGRDGDLYAVEFDLDDREVVGSPLLAVPDVATVVVSGAVELAIAADGSLAYVPGGKTSELFDIEWVAHSGETELAYPESGRYFQIALAPSGRQAVVANTDQGSSDLWLLDLERVTLTRFTFDGSNNDPVWTPDEQRVIFSSDRDGVHEKLYLKPAGGIGDVELLWDAPRSAVALDVTPDGRWLAAALGAPTDGSEATDDIWILDLTGKEDPRPFLDDEATTNMATFSPDGRWIAYTTNEAGSERIYVRPFPSAAGKREISTVSSREPRWSADGRRLYYRTYQGLCYVTVDTTDGFRTGREVVVDPDGSMGPPFNMTYSLDGDDRYLTVRPHREGTQAWRVHVVHDWTRELETLFAR